MPSFFHEIDRNIHILFLGRFSVPFYARFNVRRRRALFPEGFGIFTRSVFAKFAWERRQNSTGSCGTRFCGGWFSARRVITFLPFGLITPKSTIRVNPLFGTFSRPCPSRTLGTQMNGILAQTRCLRRCGTYKIEIRYSYHIDIVAYRLG